MKLCSSAREAWGQAIAQRLRWSTKSRISGKQQDQDVIGLSELARVDEYYQAWGISTCGTERTIGVYRNTFGLHRKHSDIQRMNDELEIIHSTADEVEISNEAALLYMAASGF